MNECVTFAVLPARTFVLCSWTIWRAAVNERFIGTVPWSKLPCKVLTVACGDHILRPRPNSVCTVSMYCQQCSLWGGVLRSQWHWFAVNWHTEAVLCAAQYSHSSVTWLMWIMGWMAYVNLVIALWSSSVDHVGDCVRLSTTHGNTGNVLEFNWCCRKFVYN